MSGSSAPAPVSSLFSSADIAKLRRDRLAFMASTYFPDIELTDEYLLEMLQVAEMELQHDLRCYFTPRQVLPDTASAQDVAAAMAANPTIPIINEPGYDYTPALFNGESWGLIQLRQLPCIRINAITFNYPSPTDVAYAIPPGWIRPDLKRGIVNLVPVQANSSLPLNAYLLSVLGGGYMAPFLMQISYVCGMANAKADYPDLINLIKRLAMCMVMENLYLPQSGSTSTDGVSGSLSVETAKYRSEIEMRVSALRDRIAGVRLTVC